MTGCLYPQRPPPRRDVSGPARPSPRKGARAADSRAGVRTRSSDLGLADWLTWADGAAGHRTVPGPGASGRARHPALHWGASPKTDPLKSILNPCRIVFRKGDQLFPENTLCQRSIGPRPQSAHYPSAPSGFLGAPRGVGTAPPPPGNAPHCASAGTYLLRPGSSSDTRRTPWRHPRRWPRSTQTGEARSGGRPPPPRPVMASPNPHAEARPGPPKRPTRGPRALSPLLSSKLTKARPAYDTRVLVVTRVRISHPQTGADGGDRISRAVGLTCWTLRGTPATAPPSKPTEWTTPRPGLCGAGRGK